MTKTSSLVNVVDSPSSWFRVKAIRRPSGDQALLGAVAPNRADRVPAVALLLTAMRDDVALNRLGRVTRENHCDHGRESGEPESGSGQDDDASRRHAEPRRMILSDTPTKGNRRRWRSYAKWKYSA